MGQQKQQSKEMFVPLCHPPGDAQVDFGEADILLCGVLVRAHYFVLDLPHSDDAFVMAFPAETSEAFCEGHIQAFAYFGGVPRHIVYDNSKLAVARFLADGGRQVRGRFTKRKKSSVKARRLVVRAGICLFPAVYSDAKHNRRSN